MFFSHTVNPETGRIHRTLEGTGKVQARPMARNYRTVQPSYVAHIFERAGYETLIRQNGRNPWSRAVVFLDPNDTHHGDFSLTGSILCGHDGRTALRITPRIVRGFCANEFNSAPISIRHTSNEIDGFLADPVGVAIRCLDQSRALAKKIERIYAEKVPAEDKTLRFWLRHAKKRQLLRQYESAKTLRGEWWHTDELWGIVQRLTWTRSPAMIKLASDALDSNEVLDGGFDRWLYAKLSKGGVAYAEIN